MQGYNEDDSYETISISSSGIKLSVYKTGESDNYGDWARVPGFVTKKSVDLTPWSKIVFTASIYVNSNYNGYSVAGGYLVASSSRRALVYKDLTKSGYTFTMDVSSLSGHYFIGLLRGVLYNQSVSQVYITKIEFVP